jgi:hypothetical protein
LLTTGKILFGTVAGAGAGAGVTGGVGAGAMARGGAAAGFCAAGGVGAVGEAAAAFKDASICGDIEILEA